MARDQRKERERQNIVFLHSLPGVGSGLAVSFCFSRNVPVPFKMALPTGLSPSSAGYLFSLPFSSLEVKLLVTSFSVLYYPL